MSEDKMGRLVNEGSLTEGKTIPVIAVRDLWRPLGRYLHCNYTMCLHNSYNTIC